MRTLAMYLAMTLPLMAQNLSIEQWQTEAPPPVQHDPKDSKHWYPAECCNDGEDCFPLPSGAVEEVKEGWRVRWTSPVVGYIDEIIPSEAGKPHANDALYHGCWRKASYFTSGRERLCFFFPAMS
jgi:hypothetical protein